MAVDLAVRRVMLPGHRLQPSRDRAYTGKPKPLARSRSTIHGFASDDGHGAPNGPGGTAYCGARGVRRVKSSTSARLFAVASRTVNGSRPHRHSIKRSTDVWSNTGSATNPRLAIGEISRHGTRNPRKPSASPAAALAGGIGAGGGGTCSKNPPHSSKLMTSSVRGHAGLFVTAA